MTIKPMLAYSKTPDLAEIKYPVYASPKLDGIRCVIMDGKAYSRSMKLIPNKHIQSVLSNYNLDNLDGELMVDGDFNDVQSSVMSYNTKPKFTYNVFDFVDFGTKFEDRIAKFQAKVQEARLLGEHVQEVQQVLIDTPEQLAIFWDQCIKLGYEGAMVRDPKGPYKKGRSTLNQGWLLKLKKWSDDEATIIGFEEELHNTNEAETNILGYQERSHKKDGMVGKGTLGSLIVIWRNKQFKIGSGFTREDRQNIWDNQEHFFKKKVTFKYQNVTRDGIPRFPIFKGIRYE